MWLARDVNGLYVFTKKPMNMIGHWFSIKGEKVTLPSNMYPEVSKNDIYPTKVNNIIQIIYLQIKIWKESSDINLFIARLYIIIIMLILILLIIILLKMLFI